MTQQYHVSTKCIHYDELSLEDTTKAELIGNLKSSGVDVSVWKKKRVSDL